MLFLAFVSDGKASLLQEPALQQAQETMRKGRTIVRGHRIPSGRQIFVFQPRTAGSSRVETTSGKLVVLFIVSYPTFKLLTDSRVLKSRIFVKGTYCFRKQVFASNAS